MKTCDGRLADDVNRPRARTKMTSTLRVFPAGANSDKSTGIMHFFPPYDMRAARQFLSSEENGSMSDFKWQCQVLLKSTQKCFKKKALRLKRSLHYLSLLHHAHNAVGVAVDDSLHCILDRYTALVGDLDRASSTQERTLAGLLDNARNDSLRIGIDLDHANVTVHKEINRLATVHSMLKTTGHLPCGLLPVFSFLRSADVVAALSVCRSWHSMLSSYCILSQSLFHPDERWRYWQPHLLAFTVVPQALSAPSQADAHHDDELLDQEVHRTTFFPKESMYMPSVLSSPTSSPSASPTATALPRIGSYSSKSPALKSLHAKLHSLLATFARHNPDVGYGHGMTFLGAALLSTLQYDIDASFRVFATLMEKHGMHRLWHGSPTSFGAGLTRRLHQLELCVDLYAPAVAAHLRAHHVTPSMFASSWILSLFLNDRSLPPSTCMHVLDTFLVEGWLAMYALYVGLIVVHARDLLDATDDAAILHALLSLPKHLAAHGLGPYRLCALTTLSPPLAASISMEIEREPHP